MTREEAQKELSELEPRVGEAWNRVCLETEAWEAAYNDLGRQLDKLVQAKPGIVSAPHKLWLPLHARKQQLKAFLEISS